MSEQVNCGTFLDWSFGGLLRRYRVEKKIGLREASRLLEMDAANLSAIEQSRHAPPSKKSKIEKYCQTMGFDKYQSEMLFTAAYSFHQGRLKEGFNS